MLGWIQEEEWSMLCCYVQWHNLVSLRMMLASLLRIVIGDCCWGVSLLLLGSSSHEPWKHLGLIFVLMPGTNTFLSFVSVIT